MLLTVGRLLPLMIMSQQFDFYNSDGNLPQRAHEVFNKNYAPKYNYSCKNLIVCFVSLNIFLGTIYNFLGVPLVVKEQNC